MSNSTLQFDTRAIHAGQDPDKWKSRAVIPPISLSTTFQQFAPGLHAGYEYSRSGNPTRNCLEEALASLENAKYALCFSSGLSTTLSVTHLLSNGDHVICFDDLYGGTNRYFRTCAAKMGIEISFVDMRDVNNIKKAIKPNTKMIWIETPTNPTMKMVDILAVSELLNKYPEIISVVDNTFMSSYFQKPLNLGADIVMHSLTKYMNGHSDVVMGAIATNNEELYTKMKYYQNSLGTVPSPFDCFLVNRGLKTLHLRMERHMSNGKQVAEFLEKHPAVKRVIYPSLKSYPQYELAQRQCSGSSGMVSFYLKGGLNEAQAFMKNLKIFILAESLGSIESLVEIPSIMTHASVPLEQREVLEISDSLIRLSVGVESIEDLIQDLDQALKITISGSDGSNAPIDAECKDCKNENTSAKLKTGQDHLRKELSTEMDTTEYSSNIEQNKAEKSLKTIDRMRKFRKQIIVEHKINRNCRGSERLKERTRQCPVRSASHTISQNKSSRR